MRRVFIKTFGCKVNYAESVAFSEALRAAGLDVQELPSGSFDEGRFAPQAACEQPQASLVIVNSCCVTAEAERKAAQFVRRLARTNPAGSVLFCGCAARNPASRRRYEEAGAIVLDNFAEALNWLAQHADAAALQPITAAPLSLPQVQTLPRIADGALPQAATARRARAFIKVQDGCANCCSYCIVPFVRPYGSRPLADALDEVTRRIAEGYRELVLTGINIGHYGMLPVAASLGSPSVGGSGGVPPLSSLASATGGETPPLPGNADNLPVASKKTPMDVAEATAASPPRYVGIPGQPTICDLISAVLELLPAGFRLRLSSIEPEDLEPRIFALLGHPRMCPHLHLPLQSGSDNVLRAMRRRYTAAEYLQLASRFRAACPNGALTTDVMVGFPGETDDDFSATLALCSTAGFERAHCFPFSPRTGTRAAELPQLPGEIIRSRNRRLIAHCRKIADLRWQRFIGQTAQVLIEEQQRAQDGSPRWLGHGEAYQIVRIADGAKAQALHGQIAAIRLTAVASGEFMGDLL